MHTMIDLETLATSNNAQIISIGACNFNKEGIHGTFYHNVMPEGRYDFDISGTTVLWWMKQSLEARVAITHQTSSPLHLVLRAFSEFCQETIWGNGSTFDNVVLRNAYNKAKIKYPVSFRHDKCYRTVLNLYPPLLFERVGNAHNALDDAMTQANHLIKLANYYNFDL